MLIIFLCVHDKMYREFFFKLARRGFEPQIFEQIPAQNLNFEGD